MKPAFLLVAASTLLLLHSPRSVLAKNASIGIYAIVDQVTFEPGAGAPHSVRISGIFVVPVPMSSGKYRSPQRGYFYFGIAPGAEQATQRDWSELKILAGSGKVVGFGQYWVPNPDDPQGNPHHSLEVTVHAEGDLTTPDVYPLPRLQGVTEVKSGTKETDPDSDKIAAQLRESAASQTASSTQQAALKSKSESLKWTETDERNLLAKARLGDASAQMWLGAAYEQGWFGMTNFREALKWFRKSAEQGNPDAQNELGRMYEEGEGVMKNYSLAANWYRMAAEHVPDLGGAGQGRNNLGMLYLDGNGVPKDYVQAYMWFRLADFESNPNLSLAKAHLTPEQILEAEQLVEAWKSRRIPLQ